MSIDLQRDQRLPRRPGCQQPIENLSPLWRDRVYFVLIRKEKYESRNFPLARPFLKDLLAIEKVLHDLAKEETSVRVQNATHSASSLAELISSEPDVISTKDLDLTCTKPYVSASFTEGKLPHLFAADADDLSAMGAVNKIDSIMRGCQPPKALVWFYRTPFKVLFVATIYYIFLVLSLFAMHRSHVHLNGIERTGIDIGNGLIVFGLFFGSILSQRRAVVYLVNRRDRQNIFWRNRDQFFVGGLIALLAFLAGKFM